MEGIPAIYIQNYLGSKNDNAKVKKTNSFRSINRRNWNFDSLVKIIKNKININSKILYSLNRLMVLRKNKLRSIQMQLNLLFNLVIYFLVFGGKALIEVKVSFVLVI